jgi:hypothetical protein
MKGPAVNEIRSSGPRILRGVNRKLVATLLRVYRVPATEFRFQPNAIADLLDEMPSGVLDDWDIAVPAGDGSEVTFGGQTFKALQRNVRLEEPGVLVVSGSKRRVGSRGVERAGLDDAQVEQAREDAHKAEIERAKEEGREPRAIDEINVADRFFRQVRSRPLLILHVLDPQLGASQEAEGIKLPDLSGGSSSGIGIVAIGLSFPSIDEKIAVRLAKYKINLVKAREVFGPALDEGDDDFTEEEL